MSKYLDYLFAAATIFGHTTSIRGMNCRFWGAVCLLAAGGSASAFGQLLSVGIKGGLPLNDGFVDTGANGPYLSPSSTTNRYIIGPEVEIRLPFRLGIEADALYRHYRLAGTGASQWDFPILLKYHFKGVPLLHPFVDAGPIFNHVTNISLVTPNQSTAGVAIGAGIDFHALLIHLEPELRYVRWGSENYNFSQENANLASNQNQFEFLVGLTF